MRTAKVYHNKAVSGVETRTVLEVDSGWDRKQPDGNRICLDFKTTRGQSVSLSVADWIKLKTNVEAIIEHCATQLVEEEEEEKEAAARKGGKK